MKRVPWPRYMVERKAADGRPSYYWFPRKKDTEAGFQLRGQALGADYAEAVRRCDGDPSVAGDRGLNGLLDDWRRGAPAENGAPVHGTLKWLFHRYEDTRAFKRIAAGTQVDYRRFLGLIVEVELVNGGMLGDLHLSSISARAVDKAYDVLAAPAQEGGRPRLRQANKAVDVAALAWRKVRRLHPTVVPEDNPFEGVTREHDTQETVPATRPQAYQLAEALVEIGHPSLGLAALATFEWHQRPENILEGHLQWSHYRPAERPDAVRVVHAKTQQLVWLPLQDEAGLLFPEIEEFIARVPRLGMPMVLIPERTNPKGVKRPAHLYSLYYARALVRRAREQAALPPHVTLAACRHGGMTELGDAEITEQGVMSLSGHKTPEAARLYVKRTEQQRVSAARRRRAWVTTNSSLSNSAEIGTDAAQESKNVSTRGAKRGS